MKKMAKRNIIFAPNFLRKFRRLQKHYRHISDDLKPLLDQLRAGETPGDQITETGYTVFKVRIKNRDAQRGFSGGYRVIYYLETAEQILMVTIYSKSDESDAPANVIRSIIKEYLQEK
jgi:mRNA-degrading endonuclease RelE of RelBE toxin-antitoxin system